MTEAERVDLAGRSRSASKPTPSARHWRPVAPGPILSSALRRETLCSRCRSPCRYFTVVVSALTKVAADPGLPALSESQGRDDEARDWIHPPPAKQAIDSQPKQHHD